MAEVLEDGAAEELAVLRPVRSSKRGSISSRTMLRAARSSSARTARMKRAFSTRAVMPFMTYIAASMVPQAMLQPSAASSSWRTSSGPS